MRTSLRVLVLVALVGLVIAALPTDATAASAGVDSELCEHVEGRADIPSSFVLDACFDGSVLHLANLLSFPVVVGYTGDRGPVTKYTLDRVPSAAAQVLNDAYRQDPGLLLPGYALRVPVNESALAVRVHGDEEIAKSYAYLDRFATHMPIVSMGSAAIALTNELADVWDADQECRRDASWAGEIKCEAIYLRDVGFALGRAGVDGVFGFVVGAFELAQGTQRWVAEVRGLSQRGQIEIAATDVTPPRASPECPVFESGTWTGGWSSEQYSATGELAATVATSGETLTGELDVGGSDSIFGGTISGTIDCASVTFGRVDDSIEFEGELERDRATLVGTYSAWIDRDIYPDPADIGTFEISLQN